VGHNALAGWRANFEAAVLQFLDKKVDWKAIAAKGELFEVTAAAEQANRVNLELVKRKRLTIILGEKTFSPLSPRAVSPSSFA